MVVTRDTDHFEISLLNIDAPRNAVKSFNNNNKKRKSDKKKNTKMKKKVGNNISDIVCE